MRRIAAELLILLSVLNVAAAQPEGVRIDYRASAGCPDAAGFLRSLQERTTHFRQAMPDEQARRFSVRVTSMAASTSGQLEIHDLNGSVAVRHVEAKSCDQVVSALALMTALAISPSTLTDSPPSTEASAEKTSEPVAERNRRTSVEKAAPIPAAQDEAQPWQWSAGMLGRLLTRISPDSSYGGEFFLEAEAPVSQHLGPSARLGVFLNQSRTELAVPSHATARFQWLGASFEACPVRFPGWRNRLAVVPCGALHLGALRAQGRGISQPKNAASFWADVGPLLRLRLIVTARISLEAQVAFILPLTRPSFEIMDVVSRTPAAEVTVTRWGTSVAAGAAYRFQ